MKGKLEGKLVNIYQDPVSREVYEGIAKIVKIHDCYVFDKEIYYAAEVKFAGEEIKVWRRFAEADLLDK